MQLALTDLIQARWTDEIHDEWIRSVLSDRPDIKPESLARCRELMDRHVPDSLVTDYEPLIPTLILPDPDDRHVLAAAIHAQAELIVTFNLGDFPASVLSSYEASGVKASGVKGFRGRTNNHKSPALRILPPLTCICHSASPGVRGWAFVRHLSAGRYFFPPARAPTPSGF